MIVKDRFITVHSTVINKLDLSNSRYNNMFSRFSKPLSTVVHRTISPQTRTHIGYLVATGHESIR
jgi:hypothetical protein